MDPVSATFVVGLLVRYAQRLALPAAHAADRLVDKSVDAVWDAVKHRLRRDPGGAETLDRLQEQPENPKRQAAVEDRLEELLLDDAEFLASLSRLIDQAGFRTISDVRVTGSGATAVGGAVTVRGGTYAAGRDLKITPPGPGRPRP